MLFINFLCLLYLMVHVDSHTISKSINNDDKVDDIFDSITDLERTRAPKLRRDRFQPKYRLDYKDEFVRPEYVFKDSRLYADTDKTTQRASPKCTSEHSKHHKSPKRRVGGFWRKFRGKDKKNKYDNISRKRRIPKSKDGKTHRPETAVYRTTQLKIKRKNKNVFTPRPPSGKNVKREVTMITETISEPVPTTEPAPTNEPVPTTDPVLTSLPASLTESISTYDPYSLQPNFKLRVGPLTPQYDNMLKNKFRIKTVEPYKITERLNSPAVTASSPLETLSTQLAHLKEKYGFINKASSNSYTASESRHRTEPLTPKTTTTTSEPEFGGTMQIEQILNDIKMKAMAKIPQQNPMITDIITNAVTEATFESDPVLIHMSLSGYEKDDPDDISKPTAKRDESSYDKDDMYLDDSTIATDTESHYIVARSLKEDTITMAHNVEDMLQRELKNIYNKVKHKVSSDFRKEINKAKSTIKEGINKISSTCKPCNSSNANTTTKATLAAHKAKFTQSTRPTTESTKEKTTPRHARDTPTLRNKTSETTELEFTRTTYDDYVMLTLYEEMLAKTHEDNVRKMLATADISRLKKMRRHHNRMSKRSPETLTDGKLRENVVKLYEDTSNMPEYDYVEPSDSGNITTRPPEMPYSENESLEPVEVPEGIMSEPEQHIHNSVSSPSSSPTDLSDTSLEGLSNKISYNDFVNGYRHYLKFQKEQNNQNFSNLVKYQAHRHHSVDDIGKFILNKIPKMPSRRRKRFLDETDMDYQEITTKSDDSWFKKHFYLFIDNGPPKKFHTSQTVSLKSAATAESKTYVTEPMPRLTQQKDPVFIRIGADEPGRTTQDTSSMNLEDLSKVLDSIKSKHTISPYYKGYKPKGKGFVTTPNISITEDGVVQIRMMPQSFIGRLFGGKRRQITSKKNWQSSSTFLPLGMYTGNSMNRVKRTAKIGSVSIIDDFKDLENKPTTALKEVFGEPGIKTRETNKYGYVDIDLVPRQTAVVKLRENPKKSRFRNFLKKFHFRKRKKTKPKQNKRSCYYGNENYGYPPRRSRFNPLKKLKDMFRMKSEPGKEGGPNPPNNMPDYDMMTSHIDTFKPVKYDKTISIEEMQRQVPNISDLLTDSLTTKRTTAHTVYHFKLDESDRALLSHDPSTSGSAHLTDHKTEAPQNVPVNPQVLGMPTDWREAAISFTVFGHTTAKKDLITTPKKTVATTKPATQAVTSIRPSEIKTKSTSHATKTSKKQKTTTQLRQPPNNVMTVNVKTLRPLKSKVTTNPNRITEVTKRTTPTTATATTRKTTTPFTTTATAESTHLFRAEPSLFITDNRDLFETESPEVYNPDVTPMMTLDDINLILNNIQSKLHKFTSSSTEIPKLSTSYFKRGTLYAKKHKTFQVPMQRPSEIEELSIKSKLTRIAKFPITKRQFKMKNLEDVPVHDESDFPFIREVGAKGYRHKLGNRYPSTNMKVGGKITKFYSTTRQPGGKRYTDYFNDLVMWHNDILNLDRVPSPVWKDILQNVQTNGVESYTTPNMTKLMIELDEMNTHLSDVPSFQGNGSSPIDPYFNLAYKDVRRYPNPNKQGVIRSLAMDDNAIVTSKDLLIKGEAKYYQYNKPSEVIKKIKSSDFISKLNNLKIQDDEKVDILVPGDARRSDPTLYFDTKEPAILVDTSLMAYDDDADSVTSGLEIKKLSRDSQKPNKSAKKQYTPFLKTNKAPMQYFTTPLPMKSTEFNKFLKEHKMDVESVTSPTLELPTFHEIWTTKSAKQLTSQAKKIQALINKEKLGKLEQMEKLKKMNSDLMKSINYTSQLMLKVTPPPQPHVKGKKDSFEDDFDRHKRYSEISKTPRLASVKAVNQKATQEDNYYNIIKTKLKERLFEKKGTQPEERVTSSPPTTIDPHNKEVEITIINFDDIEKLNNTQSLETFALPTLKTPDENINVNVQYTTELTERSEMTTTTPITQTVTEYAPKLDLMTKDDMHNGLLYKDIFKERDKTTTSTTEYTTMDNGSTTEYVDPSVNDTPTTTVNKIRYPFEKIPQMYPSILRKMPRVKDFNSPPKRVHISSHHYKYDIFYDDNKKIVKPGFQLGTKAPINTVQVGTQKRSQMRGNVVVLRHPGSPFRAQNVIHATSLGYGKRSQVKDNLRAPAIFRKGETKVEIIKQIDRTAKRNRHARKATEVTRKHRLFTWRGCKPKPEGGLSAPGENPEEKVTSKEPSTSSEPSTASFASTQPDVTILSDVSSPNDVTMAAVTDSPSTASAVLSSSPSISSVTSSITSTSEVSAHGSLVYDLKNLRRTTPTGKDKIKDKDRHRRLFNLSSLIHDKFKSIMRNLTTAKRVVTTLATSNQTTNAVSKRDSGQTTRARTKKKHKEVESDDSKDEGICITCGPSHPAEHKEDVKRKNASCGATTNATTTSTLKPIEPCKDTEVEYTTNGQEKPPKLAPHKAHTCHDLPEEPVYIEPDTYNDQIYYEAGPQHDPPTPPPAPTCSSESDSVGKHMKRDLQTQQNTFTARDVAALEVIVDLMKNTLSYEDKDIANVFQASNYIAGFPHATKSITSSNDTTNAIQVHIAIPYDFQTGKKRSPIDPVRVRKVFSAKMSTPVDLEYQVHSFEGAVEPTTEHTAATTARNTNTATAHTSRVSVEGALSPGMYLLVDKPKTGLALKPIKGKINLSDLKTRQVSASASTVSMSESKPTEAREETKSIARVTLSKDFIAAFNQQLMQLYENASQANHLSPHKQRMKRSGWKSREIKAVTDAYTNEEELYVCKRRIDWEAVKRYFGHDRVCNCKCRSYKAMCKACAASDAVVDELIFEFDNIGQYMKDHCTEIQTFFWMNPSGGQKLRDSVSRIDKSLADYYKRVKGKCQGRTCKTFSSYIDKRQIVKTSREAEPDSLTHINNELSAIAEDLNKTVALQACFNNKLKEEGDKLLNSIYSCIPRNKNTYKRSNAPSPPKKKLIKNVYSLDNINVNIICNPESASSPEPFEHTSSLAPLRQDSSTQHLNDPLVDYVLGETKPKKRKGLRKLFPRKSKKKLFSYYVTEYTSKRPRLHFKRQISNQLVTPLISDGGGAFWYDYIKPNTNEPRVARDSRHDKSIEIAVVQKEPNGAPKIQKITEKTRNPSLNTILMTVKTIPTRTFRDAETTVDYLSHNINQLLQLFGSLQDIESMNKNSNRSTMFINHTTNSTKKLEDQTKITQVGTTLETKSTKCVKKVKTKMHYKGDETTTPTTTTTANEKAKTTMQSSSMSTEHSEPGEQNETQSEESDKQPEQTDKTSELNEKESEQNEKPSAQIEKPLEFKEKPAALREKPTEGNKKVNKQVELREKQKQADQHHKQAELQKQTKNELKAVQTAKTDMATNIESLDTLEAQMSATPDLNLTPAKPPDKTTENPLNASDTIIIRDTTQVLARKHTKTKTTNAVHTVTTLRTTPPKVTTTTAKTEITEPKLAPIDETETTATTSSSFLGKLKAATLKFFEKVTERPRHPQTTDTSTTREIDRISSTETDPMYMDNSPVTTRMSPTIVIINEYDNQINSEILDDPNKDVNGYRSLLLSIIQYETNKLNDEWNRIAYGGRNREEAGLKRSVQVTKPPSTTTKQEKRPKINDKLVLADMDMEYDLMDGMKALKHLELPEPTAKPRKQEGLLNKIVNRMGIKVIPSENKQAVKKPILREASRKKLNRKRRLKLNTWKRTSQPTAPTPANQKACDSRRTPKTSQICDIQATVDHLALLEKKVPAENFEALVKNISCYKYKDVKRAFYIPYQRTGKRWDWIRNKRCLRFQVAGFNDHDVEVDDQFDVVSFGDDANDSFEKYVKGDDGIYKIINRRKRGANLKALDIGLRNIPPLRPGENEVYAMVGDSVIMACVPYVPIASANKFHWHTDRKRMLNHENVKVEGIKLTIRNVEPRNMGSYTCTMDRVVQKQVQLVVMTIPEFDVVFLPVYKTQEICSYDDLKAIQNLGPLMGKESSCGKACSVRIDEPVCQRDRGTNSSLIRATAVISMTPLHRVNCSLQCRRDIASSLVMLTATNTPYLAKIAVVLSKDGVNETLKPWNHLVRPVITHSLRKKDTNGHREYHKLVSTLAPGKVDVVVNCPAGYYLLPEYKVCSSCPPNTSSKSGDNTCRSCPRGTRAEPGASHCQAIKTPPRRYDWWWYPPCGYVVACCGIAIGCSVCILLSMIVHVLSRDMDPVEVESDEERICTPKTVTSVTATYAHTHTHAHTRPLSPSRVILPRFFRPSLTSSRATDSQETKFELWKERNIPPPLPPIDFDI